MLVIQDDAEPCRDFAELALAALELEPELPIAFFCPRQPLDLARRVYSARELGEPFAAIARSWTPVVALSWPTELAGAFLEYVAAQKWRHPRADDEAVGRFMRARGAVVLATCPSLVEHRDLVPSLVGSRPRRARTAAWFAG